ncbi:histidine triad nucleotide-binding protein [Marinibactrum halimedae]|uniref:Histidine triad nucleotide-binding protein n=1 Tax=Marinibactrum halimedae TaxID=1444977 RepID=A0AA37T5J9_9GAMM|nr:histidine triad nucleotide-binding protein [Marinibactrum halimedae]MCD9458639.1 histidine triad nucleotide-binding protein [Marinibactrum halimedae]GLS25996.1 histidine triad nucleotide-binding protein [Marinibactrum halimedae]
MSEDTIFTKIINGDIPADKLYEDDDCICIKDISPQAPTHVLLIPKKPIPRLVDATDEDHALLGKLMLKVGDIARQLGIDEAFRVVVNNGQEAGQTVFHLHLHILAGKKYEEQSGLNM